MAKAASLKTRVSTKGQVVLPKAIRGSAARARRRIDRRGAARRPNPPPGAQGRSDEDRGVFGSLGPVDRWRRSRK